MCVLACVATCMKKCVVHSTYMYVCRDVTVSCNTLGTIRFSTMRYTDV